MSKVSERDYFVHLDSVARADLVWWVCLLQTLHGTSLMILDNSLSIQVHSDASSTFGCGALTSDKNWLQVRWPASWQEVDISVKEMVPIVMLAAMWGRSWHWCRVLFHSDNMAVISVIQRKSAKQSRPAPVVLSLFLCSTFSVLL